ncbi:unnamed protein product [Euphydryas editha]|uniref:DDE-1 domain-containing protein n=1 Tax=Euphydryas editha TaxID=104508 RepID=A0AAU9UNW1_EUPED|nr:unnamed protein product [Euphydryas editha]
MNGEVFLKWLQHFVKYANPSKEAKALLLLDGHSSHKNLEVLTYAKENNIIIFGIPPHCTHEMQPLDVSFFGSLNTFYNKELHLWLRNHPGRTVTHFQVAEVFKQAYLRAATWKFAPADVTENDLGDSDVPIPSDGQNFQLNNQSETGNTEAPSFQSNVENVIDRRSDLMSSQATKLVKTGSSDAGDFHLNAQTQAEQRLEDTNCQSNDLAVAGCLKADGFQSAVVSDAAPPESVSFQSDDHKKLSPTIADISPLPKSSQLKRVNRNKGKFGILNASPDIAELKAIVADKKAADLRKSTRKSTKRVVLAASSNEEEPVASDDEDPSRIYCMDPWSHSRSREWWLQCQACRAWCHAECIGLPKTAKRVICDICKQP